MLIIQIIKIYNFYRNALQNQERNLLIKIVFAKPIRMALKLKT